MPIDTSIYQNLRPIEAPSMLDSMQKATNLSSLAMQNQRMGQELQGQALQDRMKKASIFGQALESMANVSPQERSIIYPKMREQLLSEGVITPDIAPPEYDDTFFNGHLNRYRQTKEHLESGLLKAQTAKLNAEAGKASMLAKGGKTDPETGLPITAKMLPADKVLAVSEGQRIPTMLEDIRGTIEANRNSFGPVSGRLSSLNPYNEKAQTIDAQMRAASQSFGRFMEGGVLRKEDEDKYRKMFPNLSDTPEVAANKLAIVDRLLRQTQGANVKALSASGYDTSAFNGASSAPELPNVLSQGSQGGLISQAHASADKPTAPKPKPGMEQDGYVFMGGDPSNPKSWKKAR